MGITLYGSSLIASDMRPGDYGAYEAADGQMERFVMGRAIGCGDVVEVFVAVGDDLYHRSTMSATQPIFATDSSTSRRVHRRRMVRGQTARKR